MKRSHNNTLKESAVVPPHNMEAEMSVLGAMLLDKESIGKAAEVLVPQDFYRENHKIVFETIVDLWNRNLPVDLVTVSEELRSRGQLDAVGGATYITALANSVPYAGNVEVYAQVVRDKALLRELARIGRRTLEIAYDPSSKADQAMSEVEQDLFKLSQRQHVREEVPLSVAVSEAFDRLQKTLDGGLKVVPFGYPDLERLVPGAEAEDMIVIAARPSMGKTAFALNLALNCAKKGFTSYFASAEMSRVMLAMRLLSMVAKVDSQLIRRKLVNDCELENLSQAMEYLHSLPIIIDDSPGMTVEYIRSKARQIKMSKGLDVIFVDYLQLLNTNSKQDNRTQEVAYITRALKGIAKELSTPVIALAQLRREVENKANKRPSLADLKESGEIEQTADVVIFLHRDDYYDRDSDKTNEVELIVAKQRNGPVGYITLGYFKEYNLFACLEQSGAKPSQKSPGKSGATSAQRMPFDDD